MGQIGLDIVDIFAAFLLYLLQNYSETQGSIFLFLAFIVCWFLYQVFQDATVGRHHGYGCQCWSFVIVLLDEIKIFSNIGTRREVFFQKSKSFWRISGEKKRISICCRLFWFVGICQTNTGCLIVFSKNNNLDNYVQSGELLDSRINSRLIESIFFKNGPLHDGAIIISGHTLKAAACILPVSQNQSIPKRLGLRHRAALGITEHTDAVAIVVSEETGHISWAVNGKLNVNVKPEELEHFLNTQLLDNNKNPQETKK